MKKLVLILLTSTFAHFAHAETPVNNPDDFDGLGGNKILLEKAAALNPDVENQVVQSRTVSRHFRFEIAPEYSGTFGGDTYIKTHSYGLNAYFHLNPRWSLAAKYRSSYNDLSKEGEARFERAYQAYLADPQNPSKSVPEINFPKSQTMGYINWYPIYGKINWLDKSVVQFDVYMLAGAGQVELNTGSTSSWSAGGGVGFWFTPRVSTRVEMAYQTYDAEYFDGPVKVNLATAAFQVGWLL